MAAPRCCGRMDLGTMSLRLFLQMRRRKETSSADKGFNRQWHGLRRENGTGMVSPLMYFWGERVASLELVPDDRHSHYCTLVGT